MRDRDLLDQRVQLQPPVRRLDCLSCGRVTERINWLAPAPRLTQRLRVWLEGLLQLLPISHVSRLTGLHWHTLKTLDKRRLEASVGTSEPGEVRRLVMDEFALHKGRRYVTVIMDAERTRVLRVGHGNSREAIRPFFELLGEQCQQIEAVAMDMNTVYVLKGALKVIWYAPACGRAGSVASLAATRPGQRTCTAAMLCPQPAQIRARHPRQYVSTYFFLKIKDALPGKTQ